MTEGKARAIMKNEAYVYRAVIYRHPPLNPRRQLRFWAKGNRSLSPLRERVGVRGNKSAKQQTGFVGLPARNFPGRTRWKK
jgi:hypothetical protein